jgi:hypothetical protein
MTIPEEGAKQGWDEGKKWTDESFTDVKVGTVSIEDAKRAYLRIDGSLADAWEYLAEEAREILKNSPDDPKALETLQDYRDYTRRQALPEEKRVGLILVREGRRKIKSNKGVWVRDAKYGWLVRASGEVGDVITVRKKDHTEQQVRLIERVMPGLNFFKGRIL